MSSTISNKLKKKSVGGFPLIHSVMERIGLKEILARHIGSHGNEKIPVPDSLVLLIYNLTLGKDPLYELEEWTSNIDFRCIGMDSDSLCGAFNDDRFGRALDKLYATDYNSLLTEIVLAAVREYSIDLSRMHNDSTTVKAFGKIPGKTENGLELKKGKSKDHRPDLKQLLFSLTISADGAVPVHFKTYPGNVTDDQTHIETWDTLCSISKSNDFLYVADSKLCTDKQLFHITQREGRAITLLPETWGEVAAFKNELQKTKKKKTEILRKKNKDTDKQEYYSVFEGEHLTQKRKYRIHWIYSSEKKVRDRDSRELLLKKTEKSFMYLNSRINTGKFKTEENIRIAVEDIFNKMGTGNLFNIEIGETKQSETVQIGKGRPGANTIYKEIISSIYTLTWTRNLKEINKVKRCDGVFPLLSTDKTLSAKEVLKAYKFQPRLEKRFAQFKSVHNAAPLLFKKIERVEANMFLFFVALLIQALLEREVRKEMKNNNILKLPVYPEDRLYSHPTTNKVFDRFNGMSSYVLNKGNGDYEEFRDDFTKTQIIVLKLLNISTEKYWGT